MSWARLLKRVFDSDFDHCANCGGSLKIIVAPSTRLRTASKIRRRLSESLLLWACRPAPRRAPRRSESIYSRQSEGRKLLINASRPAALASITSTSTATSTSMSKVMAVAVAVRTMTPSGRDCSGGYCWRRRDFRRRRLAGAKRAAKLCAGELRWHGLSTVRQHLVSAPGIAVRRGQSAVLIANELLVRVAPTESADAGLRSRSEHEFGRQTNWENLEPLEFMQRPGAPSAVTSLPWRVGAARSDFERAARSGTLRAQPIATPRKPAEATLGY